MGIKGGSKWHLNEFGQFWIILNITKSATIVNYL